MRMMRDVQTTWLTAAALGACLALFAPGRCALGDDAAADKGAAEAAPAASAPAGGAADDELEQFVLRRGPVPVTRSRSAPLVAGGAEPPLYGSALNDRPCRLGPADSQGWREVLFEAVAGQGAARPRRVLPCRLLERMEAVVARQPKTVFRIWGENTVYRGRLYVLPVAVTVAAPAAAPKAPAANKGASPSKAPGPADKGEKPPPAKGGAPAGVDDVTQELLRDQPGRTIVVPARGPATPEEVPGAVAPGVKTPAARPCGEVIVDRLVRLGWADDKKRWSVVRFEADNTLAEPPMRLLPCRMRAWAEALSAEGWLLRVTGQITFYKGRRHVLLRKVLRERQLDRF